MEILVCIDGEPHSDAAVLAAVRLGLSLPARVSALHVKDPYLKKFYNELYSQGRREYLEYVEECLQQQADRTCRRFAQMCREAGLDAGCRVREGDPLDEILAEIGRAGPDLVITGGKKLNAWGRFRSRKLPMLLDRKSPVPVTVVTEDKRPARLPAAGAGHAARDAAPYQ